jgi:parallel beta-helix repeat protein
VNISGFTVKVVTLRGKGGIGIYLDCVDHCNISDNTASNIEVGIYLSSSSNNRIFLNNFINNRNNVESVNSNNIWNSEEKMTYIYNGSIYTNYLGNYWSDYKGSDANNNGIGDASYIICPDEDNYPLMKRFENYFNFTTENQPPIASFTYYPENPVVNQTITFNASSSTDHDGTVENYEWDFGDGEKAEGEIVTHSYSSAKNYTVKLTVTDNEGATNSTAEIINIHKIEIPIVTTVSIKNPPEASEGENFTATVNVDGVSDLAILMFRLNYNSSVIRLTNVEKGSDIDTSGWSQWLQYSSAGILKVFAFSDPSGSTINGDAELARLEFIAVGKAGNRSVIDIHVILGNSAVEPIEAIWVGSEVRVTPAVETKNQDFC